MIHIVYKEVSVDYLTNDRFLYPIKDSDIPTHIIVGDSLFYRDDNYIGDFPCYVLSIIPATKCLRYLAKLGINYLIHII